MKISTITTALAAVTLSLAASACGGAAATMTTTTTAPAVARPTQPVDRLVAIRSGRMHLRCVGRGDTTVLLIAGWGDGGENWGKVEPAVAERARVCSYARFGTGASDKPASTQTFETEADDLQALLDAAGEPGPYVVLGHSFGGAEAVAFASKHPHEVRGLLLLDASPVTWPATVCSVPAYVQLCGVMHDPSQDPERVDVFPAFEQVAAIASLGHLPMTVMTAAHRVDSMLPPSELTRLDAAWAAGQDRWAALSSASHVITVEGTGHHIEVDQPGRVVDGLLELLP